MKIQFLGGAKEVGRSAVLVKSSKDRFLFDYGLKVNEGQPTQYPLPVQGFIDGIILSHGHLDHCGAIPVIFERSKTLVYATPPTMDIANLLWRDTLKISKTQSEKLRFGSKDVERAERAAFEIGYNKEIPVADDAILKFYDAGHIPGSALCELYVDDKTILYTGDFNLIETDLLYPAKIPTENIDILITESTYANKEHPDRKKVEKEFMESILDCVDNGGVALVASFAVGRSQELLQMFEKYANRINVPIYVDGMGQKATNIALKYPEYLKDYKGLKKAVKDAVFIKNERQRKKAISHPSIIITTAGMLQGGPVLWYLIQLHEDPKSKLFLTGYQVEHTKGRVLRDTGRIEIDGIPLDVKMPVEWYDFSAHAGYKELKDMVKQTNPTTVFCMHGDGDSTESFAKWIKDELGITAYAPKLGEEFTIK